MIEKTIDIDRMEQAVQLFGSFDENIKELEKEYGVTILSRGTDIKVSGDAEGVYNACKAIDALLSLVEKGEIINDQRVRYVMAVSYTHLMWRRNGSRRTVFWI